MFYNTKAYSKLSLFYFSIAAMELNGCQELRTSESQGTSESVF